MNDKDEISVKAPVENEFSSSKNVEQGSGEQSHGGVEGETMYGYGRQGGSIAGTGTRTDDPVGIEQVESSEVYKVSPKQASERQGDPPPRTPGMGRGEAGPTEDDVANPVGTQ